MASGSDGISRSSSQEYPIGNPPSSSTEKTEATTAGSNSPVLARIAGSPNTAEIIINGVGRQVRKQNDSVKKFPSSPPPSRPTTSPRPAIPPRPTTPPSSRKFPSTPPPAPPSIDESEKETLDLLSSTELKAPISTPLRNPTPPPRANVQVTENQAKEEEFDMDMLVQEHSFSWNELRDGAADKLSSLGSVILGGAKSALKALSEVKLGHVFQSKPKPPKLNHSAELYTHLGNDLIETIKEEGANRKAEGVFRIPGDLTQTNKLLASSEKTTSLEKFKQEEEKTLSNKDSLSKGALYKNFIKEMPKDLKENLRSVLKGEEAIKASTKDGKIDNEKAARQILANLESVKETNPEEYKILKGIIDTHAYVWATKWDGLGDKGDLDSFLKGSTFLVLALLGKEPPEVNLSMKPDEMSEIRRFEEVEVPKYRAVAAEILRIAGSEYQDPDPKVESSIRERFLPKETVE